MVHNNWAKSGGEKRDKAVVKAPPKTRPLIEDGVTTSSAGRKGVIVVVSRGK